MKSPVLFLSVVIAFAAFLCGFFVGRSSVAETLYVAPESTVSTADANSADAAETETSTEETADISSDTVPMTKVNINTAGIAQLMTLPGIGEVLAQRIVDYRLENGPFLTIYDLEKVEGIGEKTLENILPYIVAR